MIYKNMDYFKTKSIFDKKYTVLSQYLPEVMAVRFRLKTGVMVSPCNKDQFDRYLDLIQKFCSKSGLFFSHYFLKNDCKILISNKKLSINQDSEQNEDNYLSYPECCQDNFASVNVDYHIINSLRWIIADEKRNDGFDFRMNPFLMASSFHLYLHIPCSLKCKKTLDYAKKLGSVIKKENAELYSAIVKFNKVPVFYVDVCGAGILFNGKMKSGKKSCSIVYKNFYYSIDPKMNIGQSGYNTNGDVLLFEKIIQAFHRGNKAILQDDKLIIMKDGFLIRAFEKPNHLFWRMMDFSS